MRGLAQHPRWGQAHLKGFSGIASVFEGTWDTYIYGRIRLLIAMQ